MIYFYFIQLYYKFADIFQIDHLFSFYILKTSILLHDIITKIFCRALLVLSKDEGRTVSCELSHKGCELLMARPTFNNIGRKIEMCSRVHHMCSQPWYPRVANYEDRQTSRSMFKTEKGGPKFYTENHLLPIWS